MYATICHYCSYILGTCANYSSYIPGTCANLKEGRCFDTQ